MTTTTHANQAYKVTDVEIRSRRSWDQVEAILYELQWFYQSFEVELRLARVFSFRECEMVPAIEVWTYPKG